MISPRLKQSLWFHGYTVLAFAGYVVFFQIFHSIIGDSVTIFVFIPPVIVAWLNGIGRGIVAAIMADVLALFLLHFEGCYTWDMASFVQRLPGLVAVLIIAIIVGYMRELRERVKKELAQREKVAMALRESEVRFKGIFEGANDAIVLLTEKGFFDCNPRTLEMFGFKNKEEFCRVHPADISPPHQPDGKESFPTAQERIRVAYEQGSNSFEWVHRRISGEDFPAEVLLSAFNLNNQPILQATIRDISKRKKIELALAESEKNFRKMFEITTEGVALVNPQTGRFIAANPAMCALLGYSEDEFCLLTPEDITPWESKEIMQRSMQTLADGGVVRDHEGTSLCKDGSLVNVIVSNRSMPWNGKNTFHITFRDVTFIKAIQEQLKKKNAEILGFTDMVTHDLKKPLTTMHIVLELAKSGAFGVLNAEAIEAMDSGLEASKYMQELLSDLLACARLESGAESLDIQHVRVATVAADVLSKLKYQIEEKKVTVSTNGLDIDVYVDPKGLTKILINLISNAVSYSGPTPDRSIVISAEQRNDGVEICVKDNGLGIPRESQKNLFEKFKRGSNVSGISGTGLGLFIVRETVLAHGGKIWFESNEGDGAAFHFTLPNRIK